MNFPHERKRLFTLIRETGAEGVIILSGDRHLAELSMMDAQVGYPIYDITASGFNQASRSWRPFETNRHRVAAMNWGDNFGVITIDWDQPDPRTSLHLATSMQGHHDPAKDPAKARSGRRLRPRLRFATSFLMSSPRIPRATILPSGPTSTKAGMARTPNVPAVGP